MARWITIAVLAIGILGVGFWGYQEHQEKNAVLIQAENTYQRSFHELSYHMDMLHDKIGTSLAMDSRDSLSPQLVEIWRLSSQALSNVGQLPLSLVPFDKTEEFLSNIGDFTYKTAVRDLGEEPLEDKEVDRLRTLYKQSEEIKDELRQVQHEVLDDNLRWMDVQLALASQDEPNDNTIIDGFNTVENKVDGFSDTQDTAYPEAGNQEEHSFKYLTGEKINEKKAKEIGEDMFHIKKDDGIDVETTKSGDGANIPTYSLSYEDKKKTGYMDISEKGGHPLSLIINRDINNKKLSLNDGLEKAKAYLKDQDFDKMTIFESNEYNDIGVYSFLAIEDDVRVFPDAIQVKVALDNGDIIGLNARNYYMNHTDRSMPKPKLSKKEAKEKVNPKVDIQEDFMAVIDDDTGKEVLTYEFLGIIGNNTYRIFINALTGREEKVEKMGETELNFASATKRERHLSLPFVVSFT